MKIAQSKKHAINATEEFYKKRKINKKTKNLTIAARKVTKTLTNTTKTERIFLVKSVEVLLAVMSVCRKKIGFVKDANN